jgi:hypothetical protein
MEWLSEYSTFFVIPFQGIERLADFFAWHVIAFLFLFEALNGFQIPFQGIEWLSDPFLRH